MLTLFSNFNGFWYNLINNSKKLLTEEKLFTVMKKIFFLIVMCLPVVACINPRKLMQNNEIGRITFGKSGGFTNIPMEYVLFDKGQLYRIKNDSLIRIRKISARELVKIDSLFSALNFRDHVLNEPGNLTYFIKAAGAGYKNEVKWSDSSDNDAIIEFYKSLLLLIKGKDK